MRLVPALYALLLLASASPPLAAAQSSPTPYPLDAFERVLGPGQRLPCEIGAMELRNYPGATMRYAPTLRAHPAFVAQLAAFEQIVNDVAFTFYGRAPRKLVHLGGYNCRRMRRYPDWVSEHALGNALDLAGFDFGPLRGAAQPGLDPRLRGAFSVRMEQHWRRDRGVGAIHARFLHALARALIARPDLFPVVLGPAWPGHENHLHLDHAPYRVVEVFDATLTTDVSEALLKTP